MSNYLNFEQNLETELETVLNENQLTATRTRKIQHLGATNIQVMLDYEGALDDARQRIGNYLEYDLHAGTINIQITTFRDADEKHLSRVAKVRKLMLNQNNPFRSYHVYDIKPGATQTIEDDETNTDETTLPYEIKWKVDMKKI
jgi:hypothetical protein